MVGFVLTLAGVPSGFLPLPLSWLWFLAAGISAVRRAGTPTPVPQPVPATA